MCWLFWWKCRICLNDIGWRGKSPIGEYDLDLNWTQQILKLEFVKLDKGESTTRLMILILYAVWTPTWTRGPLQLDGVSAYSVGKTCVVQCVITTWFLKAKGLKFHNHSFSNTSIFHNSHLGNIFCILAF